MDALSREALADLVRAPHACCVSIYMPAHRSGPDLRPFAQEDVTRWKNLVRESRTKLDACGVKPAEAEAWLAPALRLIEDERFWQYQSDGLAAFIGRDLFRTWRVPIRVEELVVVAPQFHISPLLPLLGDAAFFVLALSEKRVRLIEASRDEARELAVPDLPGSLREAFPLEVPETGRAAHAESSRRGPSGDRADTFYGGGSGEIDQKDEILQFCRLIDRAIRTALRESSAPLVLAGTAPITAIYRHASTYAHLLPETVPGNPDLLSARELQARARPIADRERRRVREAAAERYRNLLGGERATNALDRALEAAEDGRVDVLFEPIGIHHWGRYDPVARQPVVHRQPEAGDEDLLNVAAVKTLLTGGTVYAVPAEEMPDAGAVAAVLRY